MIMHSFLIYKKIEKLSYCILYLIYNIKRTIAITDTDTDTDPDTDLDTDPDTQVKWYYPHFTTNFLIN